MEPGKQKTCTDPHSLFAVMLLSQTGRVGLQPRLIVSLTQLLNTGAVTTVQLKVLEQILASPQPVAVYVKVCERVKPLTLISPGMQVTSTDPHSLCAVTLLSQVGGVGLQPRSIVPLIQLSNTGAVTIVQVNVLVQVLV